MEQHQQTKRQLSRESDTGSDKENSQSTLPFLSPPRSLTRKRIRPPSPPAPPRSSPKVAACAPVSAFSVLMGRSHNTTASNAARSHTPAPSRKRSRASADSQSGPQLYLDFGQPLKGFTSCTDCGFVYQSGLDSDEALHRQRHSLLINGIAFNGWHEEPPNLLTHYSTPPTPHTTAAGEPGDRLLRIDSSHLSRHPSHAGKVSEIVARLNQQLGSAHSGGSSDGDPALAASAASATLADHLTLYFYVRNKRVIAAMAVRSDVHAAPIVQSASSPASYQLSLSGSRAVATGIEQVWVLERHRRDGVATRMLDACRMSHACVAQSREDIAFSQPTAMGRQLAQRYTGRHDFLAYA